MATLSADVTSQMVRWIDEKVTAGFYKSRSEVIRELLREKITGENYSKAALSEKVLRKIWDNENDEVWSSYL
ncbi:MAG: ribbon-helix-helix protein, CopG family [Candidatus Diapherotrites archaeon]